jgi:hypothetical protein
VFQRTSAARFLRVGVSFNPIMVTRTKRCPIIWTLLPTRHRERECEKNSIYIKDQRGSWQGEIVRAYRILASLGCVALQGNLGWRGNGK